MIQVKIEIWIIYMYKHGFESNFQWEIATVTLRYHVQKKKKNQGLKKQTHGNTKYLVPPQNSG